jgi:hypothetical protein
LFEDGQLALTGVGVENENTLVADEIYSVEIYASHEHGNVVLLKNALSSKTGTIMTFVEIHSATVGGQNIGCWSPGSEFKMIYDDLWGTELGVNNSRVTTGQIFNAFSTATGNKTVQFVTPSQMPGIH